MSEKLTYEELEQRINELEAEANHRKRADDELRESEARYRRLVENSPDMIYRMSLPDGRYEYVSSAATAIFGYPPEVWYDNPLFIREVMHSEWHPFFKDQWQRLLKGDITPTYEYQIVHKDEGIRWINQRNVLVRGEDGRPVAIEGVVTDITERKQMEEMLKDEAIRRSILVEQSRDGIVVLDQNGKVYEANQRYADMLGYSMEEVHQLHVWDWDTQWTKEQLLEIIHAIDDKGDNFETRHRRKDDTYYDVEVSTNGAVCGGQKLIFCVCRDITERKQTEEALRESEERYRNFFDNALVGLFRSRLSDGMFIEINSKAAEQQGLLAEEIVGKVHSADLYRYSSQRRELISKLKQDGEVHGFEADLTLHDGRDVTFSISVKAYPDKDYMEGAVIDITDRKQAEEALRSEKRLSEEYINSLPGLFYIFDNQQFVRWNREWNRVTGYSDEELANKYGTDFFKGEDRTLIEERMLKVFSEGAAEAEAQLVTKDGRRIPYYFTGLRKKLNGKDHLIGLGIDITERKRMEDEKAIVEAQLHQAQKMESIGTLAGGIAHDFNNILSIILGNAELAMDDVPEWNPALFNLEEIKTASLRAKDVVRQLLSFARKTKLEKKPTNIIPIVKESLKLLRSSIPTSIEIRQNISKDVGIILADSTQINQVLINLCTNADHAMPDGGVINVTLRNVDFDEDTVAKYSELNPGRYLNLAVSDTGHGISQEEIDRIFDPYFTTKEAGKGTGMGLAVVHGIVKEHNGIITVESEIERGTTFSIFFPTVAKEAVIETETDEKLPTGKERILFIDDEESIIKLGRQRLERLGYKVETTTSPIEALELFRSKPDQFDLVITDLTMPKMTGDKLLKDILNIRPATPSILCTGFNEKIDEIKAKKMGVTEYIEKPLDKHDFAFIVRKVLDRK